MEPAFEIHSLINLENIVVNNNQYNSLDNNLHKNDPKNKTLSNYGNATQNITNEIF